MKKIIFLILIFAVVVNCNVFALTIKGQVTQSNSGYPIAGVSVKVKGTVVRTTTDHQGLYSITASKGDVLVFSLENMQTEEVKVKNQTVINIKLAPVLKGKAPGVECNEVAISDRMVIRGYSSVNHPSKSAFIGNQPNYNREGYRTIHENGFKKAMENPLSTFSIDVDAASYSNVRRFLTNGQRPPVDAVRIEEMINYFNYDYPEPKQRHPFSITHEMARCPWNEEHLLLRMGLQGEKLKMENLPPSNIVFLIDVSGSMQRDNKLPLLKKAFKLLIQQLRPEDRIAIVVYAGNSGLVLPSTSGDKKDVILSSIEQLSAGGSTAGGAGLKLAYEIAAEHYIKEGNNRVILATDGDFNVGASSDAEMERLIEQKRDLGVGISVLGFGTGNLQDSKMEIIADKGNGNYAYIDNILEAKKVLLNEFGGTLYTIAKDVKLQVEFNPAVVESYRLIGYENRLLNDEDFKNDKKDAGELGSGHSVTALYEIKLAGQAAQKERTLKYQTARLNALADQGDELATVKFRYKKPKEKTSILLREIIPYTDHHPSEMSNDFKFSAAVAEFGMLLRDSDYKGNTTFESMINLATEGKGVDEEGYRSECIRLMKLMKAL